MILLLFAAIGLLVGLASGGTLRGAAHYPVKGLLLPVFALAVKGSAAQLLQPQTGAVLVCLMQYALLFVFLLWNHKRPVWPLFVFFGTLFNMLVIVVNGGCMPVAASLLGNAADRLTQLAAGEIYAYSLMDASTKLAFLGDMIRVGPAGLPIGFASAGDILLGIGVAILAFSMARAGNRNPPQQEIESK